MGVSLNQMAIELTVPEDFDLECMCGLIETDENERVKTMGKLVEAYRRPLFAFVRNKFPSYSAEDAEDIVQNVFITLWQKVAGADFDDNGSLRSLLFTIALRQGVDELRRRKALKRSDDEMAELVAKSLDDTAVARAWKRAAESKDQASEIMSSFRDFVSCLPDQQKLVAEAMYVNASDIDDNSALVRHIRERTGKVVTTMMVKGAKQALIEKFRQLLKNKGLLV